MSMRGNKDGGDIDLSRIRRMMLDILTLAGAGSGSFTLPAEAPFIVLFDPNGGAVNLVLPSESASKFRSFLIYNTADAAENTVIKASNGSTTILTVGQAKSALVFCDGTTWRGLLGS